MVHVAKMLRGDAETRRCCYCNCYAQSRNGSAVQAEHMIGYHDYGSSNGASPNLCGASLRHVHSCRPLNLSIRPTTDFSVCPASTARVNSAPMQTRWRSRSLSGSSSATTTQMRRMTTTRTPTVRWRPSSMLTITLERTKFSSRSRDATTNRHLAFAQYLLLVFLSMKFLCLDPILWANNISLPVRRWEYE